MFVNCVDLDLPSFIEIHEAVWKKKSFEGKVYRQKDDNGQHGMVWQ